MIYISQCLAAYSAHPRFSPIPNGNTMMRTLCRFSQALVESVFCKTSDRQRELEVNIVLIIKGPLDLATPQCVWPDLAAP